MTKPPELRAYWLCRDIVSGLYKIRPADGPGGVITATVVDLVNVIAECQPDGRILVNGVLRLNTSDLEHIDSSNASCTRARFQPATQVVEVRPIQLAAKTRPIG